MAKCSQSSLEIYKMPVICNIQNMQKAIGVTISSFDWLNKKSYNQLHEEQNNLIKHYELRSNKNNNWAHPIDFPTVFTAYGAAIRSGNWQSCTSINTPTYVIDNYFDEIGHNKHHPMYTMWEYCKQLKNIAWDDVKKDEASVCKLIELANYELNKLDKLANY